MSGTMQVLPLPKITGVWRHEWSKYPDAVRVPMSDGKVVRYVIEVEQPAPVLRDGLEKFDEVIGYERKERKSK